MHAMVRALLAVAALAATPSTADKAPRVLPGTYFVELTKALYVLPPKENFRPDD